MGNVAFDFTGLEFDRLTGIRRVENVGRGLRWLWQCSCGKQTVVDPSKVKSGHTRSCGCLWPEKCRKHGHGHDASGKQSRTYKAWVNMRSRVSGRYEQYDASYGSRGITVCDRWLESFDNFLEDMGECPDGKSLDRYPDNDGNYEKSNCRWATQGQQNRNKRGVRMIVFNGTEMCLVDACKLVGMHPATVQSRLNSGMTPEEALLRPAAPRRKPAIPDMGSAWMLY